GLVTSEGSFWLRQRRMMSPHFHRQHLGALTEVMVKAINEGLENWCKFSDQTEPVEVTHEFGRITMSIIMRTMFGSDMTDEEFDDTAKKIAFILEYMLPQAITAPLPSWIPIPKRAQYQQYLKDIDAFIYQVIERRRQNLSNDLISMLIAATDDDSGE